VGFSVYSLAVIKCWEICPLGFFKSNIKEGKGGVVKPSILPETANNLLKNDSSVYFRNKYSNGSKIKDIYT
jgi:hypothetical protein